MGISSVIKHSETTLHKKLLSAETTSQLMDKFLVKKNTEGESKVVLAEICKIFHTIKHNQSYNSLDCCIKLDKMIYSDSSTTSKLSCGRTKSEMIVQNVLARKALNIVIEILKKHSPQLFFAIQLDASNRKNIKLFPISIQIFTFKDGLKNYLLHFCENSNETADGMFAMVDSCLKLLKLDWKYVSCLSADNTNSNFGQHHSLYTKMTDVNKHIKKGNCHAHIIHNCVKFSIDFLGLDVENLILKIYSHFSMSAKRREELKSFHEFVDCEWRELIRHVGTRWLSLNPCIERILLNYSALCSYFLSLENCPPNIKRLLKIDDNSDRVPDEIETYLLFCNHTLNIFQETIKIIESNESTCLDIFKIMDDLRRKIISRMENDFYGFETKKRLKQLNFESQTKLQNDFNTFYKKSLEYLESRFDYSQENWLAQIARLNLTNTFPTYNYFEEIFLKIDNPNLNINMDILFNEVSLILDNYDILVVQKSDYSKLSTGNKWKHIFNEIGIEKTKNVFSILSFLLSIPASSAFSERCFSVMTIKWRDERNRCSVDLIRSELLIYFNFKESCQEFYEHVKNDRELMSAAKSNQKYAFKF